MVLVGYTKEVLEHTQEHILHLSRCSYLQPFLSLTECENMAACAISHLKILVQDKHYLPVISWTTWETVHFSTGTIITTLALCTVRLANA